MYKALYLATAEYKLFSSTYGISTNTDYILGHETSLNKFKGVEIVQKSTSWFFEKINETDSQTDNLKKKKEKPNYTYQKLKGGFTKSHRH